MFIYHLTYLADSFASRKTKFATRIVIRIVICMMHFELFLLPFASNIFVEMLC